ncbi:APC family permease [Loigolactobacillus iwatensis]|uniref:APC family permease n=1 Tax=Loigolactobacillus iwatensis TaxID=1267156 RepID=UPI000F7E62C7|nr:amino acid permease [Loigolactobacillus iwatensis]
MSVWDKMLKKQSLDKYLAKDKQFVKSMNAFDLMSLGIGAVIGTGIFILPGTVAALKAGPAIVLSFVVAAIVCSIAAMCYAEFSSAMPIAGSAYSYGNVVFGEFTGWVLGWALILEYMLAVAAVSTGFSAYLSSFLQGFGLEIPKIFSGPFDPAHGTYLNLFAVLIVWLITWMLSHGMKESVRINNVMVIVKITIIVIFLLVGAFYVKPANWHPFLPFGVKGIFKGASTVFFAYLGFDAVSSSAAEVKNPQRNMPIGIIGTLIVATILYILVSAVLTGMVSYKDLNVANPVTYALQKVGQNWVAGIISIGALAGMFTMMITMIYSSSRLVYSIGRDGLLPKFLGQLQSKTHLPQHSLILVTIIISILGGLIPLDELTNLVNIGTLIAFTFISIGIIPLRRHKEIKNTGFKVPLSPVLPIISAIFCIGLMAILPAETWIASLIWFAIGLLIYFTYGIHHENIS